MFATIPPPKQKNLKRGGGIYCVKIYPDFNVCTFLSDELFKKMGLTVMNLNSKNKEY